MERLTIKDAAARLGVHPDTVRRRIARGELRADKEVRAQGTRWLIEVPDAATVEPVGDAAVLAAKVDLLQSEVESRRREISELHQLLAQSQQQLAANVDHGDGEPAASPQTPVEPRRRRLTLRERLLGRVE